MKVHNPDVQKAIESWYNNMDFDVIYYWSQDDTWFIVTKYKPSRLIHPDRIEVKMDFVRVFPSFRMPGEYHLSVDKTIEV